MKISRERQGIIHPIGGHGQLLIYNWHGEDTRLGLVAWQSSHQKLVTMSAAFGCTLQCSCQFDLMTTLSRHAPFLSELFLSRLNKITQEVDFRWENDRARPPKKVRIKRLSNNSMDKDFKLAMRWTSIVNDIDPANWSLYMGCLLDMLCIEGYRVCINAPLKMELDLSWFLN